MSHRSNRTSSFYTKTFLMGKPPGVRHRFGDPKCPACYSPPDGAIVYPIACPCGGRIHQQFGELVTHNDRGELIPDGPVEITYKVCERCGADCGSKFTTAAANGEVRL